MAKLAEFETLVARKLTLQSELNLVQKDIDSMISKLGKGSKATPTTSEAAVVKKAVKAKAKKITKTSKFVKKTATTASGKKVSIVKRAPKEDSPEKRGGRYSSEAMAEFAAKYPTFTADDLVAHFGISKNYAGLKIHQLNNQEGVIERVSRGVYKLKAA